MYDNCVLHADMLLQSHEDQAGALLMPSAHGSSNYSSEMRSILPGISLESHMCCNSHSPVFSTLIAFHAKLELALERNCAAAKAAQCA